MTVGVGWGHCTSNLNDTDLNSSLLTSSFDINMLTCVVNRSIHWYKCTISPFHCSCSQPRNTYCHRNLHANVFSSADMDDTDDDDFMLIIVHFKSLYRHSSCRWSPRQHFPAALSLAADWRHRDWWRWWSWYRMYPETERAIPCLPPDPSGNPQFGIFFPRPQLGETVVQGFRTPEIDEALSSSSSKSRMTCLKSAQFG